MKGRWLKFWTGAGATGDPEPGWVSLSARYAEPHRAYHTLRHIGHCLDEFEAARPLAADPAAAAAMGLPPAFGARVAGLIRVSSHREPAAGADPRLFADIDLAILGQPAAAFDEYERQVRVEYSWVAEPAFRAGRSAILQSFLERASVYGTDFFRRKYEAAARQNLSRSLARLR